MASPTKMIIITSNEDIIRQFALNKITNTYIMNLNNDNQMTSITKDNNNIINLNFLAELSELNSNNDQVYQRVLDSPDQNPSEPTKVSKKSTDFNCAICNDHAIGRNYGVFTCSSCKAFFRRHAHQNLENLRCPTRQHQCSVSHEIRRKCPRCRLDRCFAVGMRKDLFMTEEQKQQRRKRLEQYRNNLLSIPNSVSRPQIFDETDHLSMDINDDDDDDIIVIDESTNSNSMEDTVLETLSIEDWAIIQSVRSPFLSIFRNDNAQVFFADLSDRVSALISWSQFLNQIALRLINFFRLIDEFEKLHADDRFILIKYNLFSLFPISKSIYYNPMNDHCSYEENEVTIRYRQFLMLCGIPNGFRELLINLILSLVEVTKQDSTLLSLFLVILIFSPGLSMSESEPPLKDSLAVNRAQSHYTKALWNYLVNKWGEVQAYKHFTQLLAMILRLQSLSKRFREYFRVQYMTPDTKDRMAPLMQSVLHIS